MRKMDREIIEKKLRIMELYIEIYDPVFSKFFDVESDKMLDDKIEVLTALKEGKEIFQIPKFYDVLELMPKDGEMWD